MTSTGRRGPVTFADVETQHLGYLLNVATRHLSRDVTDLADANGMAQRYLPTLRPSHFRLLSLIPADGARITDLIYVADMTKQGIGQFMDHLEGHGYVTSGRDPLDRRARVVRRTELGDQAVRDTNTLFEQLERRWRETLGPSRYDTFRAVLFDVAALEAAQPVD
jgi:DNA-binding MarR family transcriptional regulator